MNANTEVGPMVSETSRRESLDNHTEYFRITLPQLAENIWHATSQREVRECHRTGPLLRSWTVPQLRARGVAIDKTWGDLALATVSASLEKQGLRLERTTVPTEKLIVGKIDKVPTD
jgi:hypothetical protein